MNLSGGPFPIPLASDPANACDTQSQGCFGEVLYEYQIGKHEVTNRQYAEFLNAVAAPVLCC